MTNVTIFESLLITHFVMDWIFQTSWEALQKDKKWLPLFVHCFVYSVGFIPAFWYFNVNFIWLILIFVSHIILDRRKFEFWVLKRVKNIEKEKISESFWNILLIGVDQTFHLAIIFIVAVFS